MTRIEHRAPRRANPHLSVWVLLVLVLALAACLRWFRFTTLPPGLWYDEAYTLAEGQRLAQGGEPRVYYPEKHGEPAVIWLTALALRLGADHLAPRWVTSVSSLIGVLLLFFAVRDVMRRESKHADWLALGSTAVLGTNYEYLFHSRMSWQAALVTTPFIAAVWLFWRGMRGGRCRDFIFAGLIAGISQYTGVAARLLPLTLLLTLLGWLGKDRQWWRARWQGLVSAGGAALLTCAPLAGAFFAHPEWFGRRLQTAAPSSAMLPNVWRTLGGWLWMGEAALHSLPGRPILDPAMGLLLLAGTGVAAWRIRRPDHGVWLAWFVGVLPGGFLSDPAPMFYRVTPAVPAAAVLCTIGGWHILRTTITRFPRLRNLTVLLLLGVLAASLRATYRDYFVRWANWPRLPLVMDVWKWRAAETILDSPTGEAVLVTIPDGLEPAITYALHARTASAVRAFDGAHCLVYPTQASVPTHYIVILGYEHRSLTRLQALFPAGYQTVDPAFRLEAPYFVNFFIPRDTKVPVLGSLSSPIRYQDVMLHGVHLPEVIISAGQTFTVTLTWEMLKPTSYSYTAFVHLLDGRPEAADAPLKAQHDGLPCDATEPTWKWEPGEYILDEHVLAVPSDVPPGEYLLGVGLYDAGTAERLPPMGERLHIRWGEAIVGTPTVVTR